MTPASRNCVHRGEPLRREICPHCNGRRWLKVFTCTIHAECTMGKKLPGLKCCATCDDFEATAESSKLVTGDDVRAEAEATIAE